jgi:hypothetical protein
MLCLPGDYNAGYWWRKRHGAGLRGCQLRSGRRVDVRRYCLHTTQVPSTAKRHPQRRVGVWLFWNAPALSSLLYFGPEPIPDFRVV